MRDYPQLYVLLLPGLKDQLESQLRTSYPELRKKMKSMGPPPKGLIDELLAEQASRASKVTSNTVAVASSSVTAVSNTPARVTRTSSVAVTELATYATYSDNASGDSTDPNTGGTLAQTARMRVRDWCVLFRLYSTGPRQSTSRVLDRFATEGRL